MRNEFDAEGADIEFASVNAISALDDQQKLIDRCAFPLFQDTAEDKVWELQRGQKDDFFVYHKDGTLSAHLTPNDGTNLSTEEGYQKLRTAIVDAQ